jgi:tRNA 2-thiouridine synthesizing protein E
VRGADGDRAQGGLTPKVYRTDVRGFLVDPASWDEPYAICRAREWKMPGRELTDRHWQVIYFLRERFRRDRVVPTVYATCRVHGMDIRELECLFPDGYHRGAVKIAGLCSL